MYINFGRMNKEDVAPFVLLPQIVGAIWPYLSPVRHPEAILVSFTPSCQQQRLEF
jgi:hypothetical protein